MLAGQAKTKDQRPKTTLLKMEAEMKEKEKMLCADCGVEMNHHANKIEYATFSDEMMTAREETFGGTLQEAHSCPECGQTALREAVSD
jgi:ribosomal protein S27AE